MEMQYLFLSPHVLLYLNNPSISTCHKYINELHAASVASYHRISVQFENSFKGFWFSSLLVSRNKLQDKPHKLSVPYGVPSS